MTHERRIQLTALTVGVWLGCTAKIREKVAAPLRTLANLMEAMREGDYSIRASLPAPAAGASIADSSAKAASPINSSS